MTNIRNYLPQDFPSIKQILEFGGLYWETADNEAALARKSQRQPDSLLVAVEDDIPVGVLLVVEDFMPFLFRLAVHPEHRNKGIGTKLMRGGEELLKQKGFAYVNILVASDDAKLQRYYERQGYEKGHTYTWMTKEFTRPKSDSA